MTSEAASISALLSEPSSPEEQLEASDDLLSAVLESIKSNEKEVELSPEEVAWADSCLVQTSEMSDEDWEAMRRALPDVLEDSVVSPHDTYEGTHSTLEANPLFAHAEEIHQHLDVHMEQRNNNDDNKDSTEGLEVAEHVLRGADDHAEQMDRDATRDKDANELASSEVHEDLESRDAIFKVWDLEESPFSDEEGELIRELKKLLKGTDLEASYPPVDDTGEAERQVGIDELVANMTDLSLQQFDG